MIATIYVTLEILLFISHNDKDIEFAYKDKTC
jgi:hypothetical protein